MDHAGRVGPVDDESEQAIGLAPAAVGRGHDVVPRVTRHAGGDEEPGQLSGREVRIADEHDTHTGGAGATQRLDRRVDGVEPVGLALEFALDHVLDPVGQAEGHLAPHFLDRALGGAIGRQVQGESATRDTLGVAAGFVESVGVDVVGEEAVVGETMAEIDEHVARTRRVTCDERVEHIGRDEVDPALCDQGVEVAERRPSGTRRGRLGHWGECNETMFGGAVKVERRGGGVSRGSTRCR
ncbi:MAG: hypothetical protein R2697_07910 [Ilumatobacteraceae bacterium]